MDSSQRYIAIEGPIGVGKTSLAKKLALDLGSELLLEQAEDNPFLERFYQNQKQSALATQLFFVFAFYVVKVKQLASVKAKQ